MKDVLLSPEENRLLILAPIGKDAILIQAMLQKDAACVACRDVGHVTRELSAGAGALIATEEAVAGREEELRALINQQPSWSDLPVILLTGKGADSSDVAHATAALGNVTLIERPVRMGALVSAVRSAMRARKRQYQTRAHMEERERADQKKNEFLATLAHELRNPLAPIRSSLELLRLSSAYPKIAAVCEVVERQVSHMVRLVDDLMEVSRITRGKIELRKEAVDLATIIKTAVETSRPLLDSARHELTMTLSAEPVVLDADPVRLAQVFSNLLNNAAKYTEPGGRISIDVRSEPGSVVVTISDNGIGIPLHALETVFEMFSQVPAKGNRAQSGLGIGLALARSLVEMHSGTLTAISPGPGQGSSFMVRLPVPDRESTVINPSATNSLAIHGAPRILVVDDNQDAANALGTFLEALGGNVRIAYDGRSALNACLDFHPQIVFLDLGMPGMDGYEVARRIRSGVGEGELCVVALTGWGQEQDRVKASQAGFDHHLTKPADPADIVELVNHPPRCATAGKFESWRIGPSM